MIFKEFGEKSRPAVLLVEGREDLAEEEQLAPALLQDYHIIVPVQDGSEASVRQEADSVLHYVQKREDGKLYAICGSSRGWKLIQELLKRRDIHSGKVIIENGEADHNHLILSMLKEFALEDCRGREAI